MSEIVHVPLSELPGIVRESLRAAMNAGNLAITATTIAHGHHCEECEGDGNGHGLEARARCHPNAGVRVMLNGSQLVVSCRECGLLVVELIAVSPMPLANFSELLRAVANNVAQACVGLGMVES